MGAVVERGTITKNRVLILVCVEVSVGDIYFDVISLFHSVLILVCVEVSVGENT